MPALKSICRLLCVPTLLLAVYSLSGCGSSTTSAPTTTPPTQGFPTFVTQPANTYAQIGQQGTFSVSVIAGGTVTYQWYRNSAAISGATSATYTTPATTSADSGASFTVNVTNSLGTAISHTAVLYVGGRAPKAGDLRFQQVDSASTISAYQAQQGGNLATPVAINNSIGSPLELSPAQCIGAGCIWPYITFAQPSGAAPLTAGYISDAYTALQTDIANGYKTMPALTSGNVVVTSLSVAPANNLYALSYIQASQSGSFDLAQHSVSLAQLQASATTEGALGRVITAVTIDSGNVDYFSYGWTGDTSTVYESRVLFATFSTAGSIAASLASQGYIITAMGDDAANPSSQIIVIGTRVQGDTTPRSILTVPFTGDPTQFSANGYAVVGVIPSVSGGTLNGIWITER